MLKDFHFNSLHTAIDPLVIRLGKIWNWGAALVRTEAGKTKEAWQVLKKSVKTLIRNFLLLIISLMKNIKNYIKVNKW